MQSIFQKGDSEEWDLLENSDKELYIFNPETDGEPIEDDPESIMVKYEGEIYEAVQGEDGFNVEIFGGLHKPVSDKAQYDQGKVKEILDEAYNGDLE